MEQKTIFEKWNDSSIKIYTEKEKHELLAKIKKSNKLGKSNG